MDSQEDLTSPGHWSQRYSNNNELSEVWYPRSYDSLILYSVISEAIRCRNSVSVLEVGCGNSNWLPYLAKKFGLKVAGIDYSELGCKLAENNLLLTGVEGKIFCEDVLKTDVEKIGQYDFVFSLGLVEHFTNLENILAILLKFVRPDGILFTEVPNLYSIHGVFSKIWQPKVLAMHKRISLDQLQKAYQNIGLKVINCDHIGLFSFGIVAWELEPRWPRIEKALLPLINITVKVVDRILRKTQIYSSKSPFLAPYIYAYGYRSK